MTREQLMEVNKCLEEWGLENVENVILIKSGATNGDMIKALYPNADYYQYYSDCIEGIEMESAFSFADFDRKWWDMPYQKGDLAINSKERKEMENAFD